MLSCFGSVLLLVIFLMVMSCLDFFVVSSLISNSSLLLRLLTTVWKPSADLEVFGEGCLDKTEVLEVSTALLKERCVWFRGRL